MPSAERSVMRSVLQHTKTRAAYACGKQNVAISHYCCGIIKHEQLMYVSCFTICITAVSITSFRTNLCVDLFVFDLRATARTV